MATQPLLQSTLDICTNSPALPFQVWYDHARWDSWSSLMHRFVALARLSFKNTSTKNMTNSQSRNRSKSSFRLWASQGIHYDLSALCSHECPIIDLLPAKEMSLCSLVFPVDSLLEQEHHKKFPSLRVNFWPHFQVWNNQSWGPERDIGTICSTNDVGYNVKILSWSLTKPFVRSKNLKFSP